MIYKSEMNSPCYHPPILGNGDLTFPVDCEGGVYRGAESYLPLETFQNIIYRAGRRTDVGHDRTPGHMLSFGKLYFDAGEMISFEQELQEENGIARGVCTYAGGAVIETECFIHPELPLYCVRKTLVKGEATECAWKYELNGYDECTQQSIIKKEYVSDATGAGVNFVMMGQDVYTGSLRLTAATPVAAQHCDEGAKLAFTLGEKQPHVLYMTLCDDLFPDDEAALLEKCAALGYEGLRKETVQSWNDFHANGWIKTEDAQLDQVYRTALYHLRAYTTRWSIPVGLNELNWHGKFFAFDEYYSFLGLMGANQHALAKRVPTFRLEKCLQKAIHRQTHLHTHPHDEAARFRWETSEYGEELSIPGFYYDHIFHMSVIALGAWEYYEYTQDKAFLEQCYCMIRACAKFFTVHMLYEIDGKAYIGKCTDLERLGNSVFHPFFTVCGAIRTMQVTAAASAVLGIDEEYRAECEEVAKKLLANLPEEGDMYVPYVGCDQKSIAMFTGKFPFDVLEKDDEKMHAAWRDFLTNGAAYGNMYKTGKSLSPWYACWEAEGFARCAMPEEAYGCLKRAFESIGVFGEMFEINEPARRLRPWFTTASGVFMSAVNEMLVQSDGEGIELLPAMPMDNVAFKLAVKGGAVLEVEVVDSKLSKAVLHADDPKVMQLRFRGEVYELKSK